MAMLQNTGQHARPHPLAFQSQSQSQSQAPQSTQGQDGTPFFNMDPSQAKQMAALNAANLARMSNRSAPGSSAPGGTSVPFVGGTSLNLLSRQDGHDPGANSFPNVQAHHQPNPNPNAAPAAMLSLNPTNPFPGAPGPLPAPNPAFSNRDLFLHKRRQFLHSLANIHAQRHNPLPPQLTAVPTPYDPARSQWKTLEISGESTIRLAGKEVDLFRLWQLVAQAGGVGKLTQHGLWPALLPQFHLPEQVPRSDGSPFIVANALAQIYTAILVPFDEAYRRNMAVQQQRAYEQAQKQGSLSAMGPNGLNSQPMRPPQTGPGTPVQPHFPNSGLVGQMPGGSAPPNMGMNIRQSSQPPSGGLGMEQDVHGFGSSSSMDSYMNVPSSGAGPTPSFGPGNQMNGGGAPSSISTATGLSQSLDFKIPSSELDSDPEARKRKLREAEEAEGKRARMRTAAAGRPESFSSNAPVPPVPPLSMNAQTRPRPVPQRRKIQYIPLAREVDTHGGRDLRLIHEEFARASRRQLQDLNEWGTIDTEALTMSLRSRLTVELSYALTTFTLLSILKEFQNNPNHPNNFYISHCPDLLDEALDLIEDLAFDDVEDEEFSPDPEYDLLDCTHHKALELLQEEGSQLFTGTKEQEGNWDAPSAPRQRPADIILTVLNIFRNLSINQGNHQFMAHHARFMDVLLRICGAVRTEGGGLRAASSALTLSDLIRVRRDVVHMIANISLFMRLSSHKEPSERDLRNARRLYELLAFYIVDPAEAVTPTVMAGGLAFQSTAKPPILVDIALEAFTRVGQPDSNRHVFSLAVPQEWMWLLVEALVHRLPVDESDFACAGREYWLSYIEKTIMALYTISFVCPPELKARVKTDRRLGFTRVLLRLVRKFLTHRPLESRVYFQVSARRAVETMKLVDDGQDGFFDAGPSSASAAPTLAFGVGYGELGETRVETGTGMLGGHQDDVTLGLLTLTDLEDTVFKELDSLARVG